MVKISNRMSREQMQEVVNEMTAWHDRKLKYENALKLICAAGMCCPQCRSMVVSMLSTADRFGVLSQVVQTTMEMFQAETDAILVTASGPHVDPMGLMSTDSASGTPCT